mgnify:CR=1 FL=1
MEPEERVQVCQLVPDEEALDADNDGAFLKIGDRYYILLAEGMACEMYVDLKPHILETRVTSLQSIMTRIAIDPAGALTAASPATRFFVEAKDEVTDRVVYKYDSEFNLSNVVYLDSAGNEMMKVEYEYLDGELKSYSEFNEDGNFAAKTIFKYDSNRVEQNDYDSTGKLQSKFITKINADENPVEFHPYLIRCTYT